MAEKPRSTNGDKSQDADREAERRFRIIKRYMRRRKNLLDIGCTSGRFLDIARKSGWQVTCVTLSDVGAGSSHAISEPDASFDVITIWDLLDSLSKPTDLLQAIHGVLHPGGMLMFSIPNPCYWDFKPLAEGNTGDTAGPVTYYDRDSLRELLSDLGFERVRVVRTMANPRPPDWLQETRGESVASSTEQHTQGRLARIAVWITDFVKNPQEDPFRTLEAVAFVPAHKG